VGKPSDLIQGTLDLLILKTVSLEPAKLNATPLGACIKNVLSVAAFPTAKDEMQVAVALKSS
jgi:hypothetical protein